MKSEELLRSGVPTKLPIPVIIYGLDIANVCKNSDIKDELVEKGKEFYELIKKNFGIDVADFYKLKNSNLVEVYTDEDTLDTYFIMSIYNILWRISDLTNNDSLMCYDLNGIVEIKEELKNISEEEFQEKFPILYNYYISKKEILFALSGHRINLKRMNSINKILRIKELSKIYNCDIKTIEKMLETNPNNYNYQAFIKEFIGTLDVIYEQLPKVDDSVVKVDFNIDERDKDKFNILMTYSYQDILKDLKKEYQQKYLYFISTFYFENPTLDKKIYIPSYDKIISCKEMFEDYEKILRDNPDLKIHDFNYDDFKNMTLEEVDEFMDEYLKSLSLNWEFFNNDEFDEEIIKRVKNYYENNANIESSDLKKILDEFIKKKNFFDKSDPYYRIFGKNAFDGYVGYVYSNGMVVLEKFFENTELGKLAKNQAIYVMPITDFNNLTTLSKNKIIAGRLCKRFYHKGDWMTRVQDKIDQEGSINVVTELSNIVKR